MAAQSYRVRIFAVTLTHCFSVTSEEKIYGDLQPKATFDGLHFLSQTDVIGPQTVLNSAK